MVVTEVSSCSSEEPLTAWAMQLGSEDCGDGILDEGEQCDDGNGQSCDGCSTFCETETGFNCGDGILLEGCGEQCDDGNNVDGDGCQGNCLLPRCGDAIVDPGEECDDGNDVPFDGCEPDCTEPEVVPAASRSGSLITALLLLASATVVLLHRRRLSARSG
jgi:cysteine-rich repeat protein